MTLVLNDTNLNDAAATAVAAAAAACHRHNFSCAVDGLDA